MILFDNKKKKSKWDNLIKKKILKFLMLNYQQIKR
jgi:hypothetical protein